MFIKNYSRYDYLYLIHEKSQSQDMFKNFKVKVENLLNKRIKIVKFNCDSEYYGIYDRSSEQHLGSFVRFLEEYSIVP